MEGNGGPGAGGANLSNDSQITRRNAAMDITPLEAFILSICSAGVVCAVIALIGLARISAAI